MYSVADLWHIFPNTPVIVTDQWSRLSLKTDKKTNNKLPYGNKKCYIQTIVGSSISFLFLAHVLFRDFLFCRNNSTTQKSQTYVDLCMYILLFKSQIHSLSLLNCMKKEFQVISHTSIHVLWHDIVVTFNSRYLNKIIEICY